MQAPVIKGNMSLPAERKVNVMPVSWKEIQIPNAREWGEKLNKSECMSLYHEIRTLF